MILPLEIEVTGTIKRNYTLEEYITHWLSELLGKECRSYKSFDKERQRSWDSIIYTTLKKSFCGNKRLVKESYRIYWRQVRKYRKK